MKKEVYLFGAGYQGKLAFEKLKYTHEIAGFVDNNKDKQGREYMGVPCFSFNELKNRLKNSSEVIITTLKHKELRDQLQSIGVKNVRIFLDGHIYTLSNEEGYRRCCRCVMDNESDPTILFNEMGECNYCTKAYDDINKVYFPNEKGKKLLENLISEVKKAGKDKKYDCVMGLSGGLDSSYLAYLGYEWGLRVLAIHIDDGYDTDISKHNLHYLIKKTGFDYEVITPDSSQYNDLTLAYMKAGVPNIAIPQDNILFAFLYRRMKELGLEYFLSGGNFALESILQKGNTYNAFDLRNILDIHRRFGTKPIDKLELLSFEQKEYDKSVLNIKSPRPLNYIDYNRKKAFEELNEFCGFQYYGRKHLENKLTAFAQLYWFPKKFGVDKRTSHLSSMIVSGQMTRELALKELEAPMYNVDTMDEYINCIKEHMHIDEKQFIDIVDAPTHSHEEYDHS